jgi:hypothetical protein
MLNAPLAELYGIPGLEGRNFRKVALPPGSHRGGVLTMASILKVTANGTTTSPVLRGAWVLDRILGTPPPKPNVDVEAVEPDIRGATTIREQLAKHRSRPECASCHAKIDPPGFALESFDVIGGWRQNYRSVGKGEAISGRRYKKARRRHRRHARRPEVQASTSSRAAPGTRTSARRSRQLLTDRGAPGSTDKAEIETIVRAVRSKEYGFRTLHDVVRAGSSVQVEGSP